MSLRLPLMEVVPLRKKVVVGVGVHGGGVGVNFEVNKLISRHFINTYQSALSYRLSRRSDHARV